MNIITGFLCIVLVYKYVNEKLNTKLKFHIVNDEHGMNESIVFQFEEAEHIWLYFQYDTVDYGKIFALNDSNNKIYYPFGKTGF